MTKERERELEIVREMNSCVHFTGIHREVCKAGVEYRSLVGGPDLGWATRIPCILSGLSKEPRATCELKNCPTREEAAQLYDDSEALIDRTMKAVEAAHQDAKAKGFQKGHGGKSGMECPTGCGGALNYTVATYNGHMHAICTTDDCVRWME